MKEYISCNCKCKFNITICDSNQKWNIKTCQCERKNYCECKKYYSWNPSTCVSENSNYLKSIADTSVIECDEIIIVIDNASTKKTNTIATNVTRDASVNCKSKRVEENAIFCIQFY